MKKAKFKRWAPLYLMMAPGLIYLFINNYMPMAGLVVAFKNYNVVDGIFGSPWAGLSNFTYLFNDAWTITRNTLLYNIVFIIINLILGIAFAIFICDFKNYMEGSSFQFHALNCCFQVKGTVTGRRNQFLPVPGTILCG